MRMLAVSVAFLLFGVVMGTLTMESWSDRNGETSPLLVLLNAPGVFLGDEAYVRSIDLVGDSRSERAHATIPQALRVPNVYVAFSVLAWGAIGLLVGWATRGARHR